MVKLLLLLWLGLSGCPGVEKPRQPTPAVEETPTYTPPTPPILPTPSLAPTTSAIPTEQKTTTMPVTPSEPEVPAEVVEEDSDPRSEEEVDTAVLPSVWVYFSRDDKLGYRSVFLFGHREKVSAVRVSYAVPFLAEFKNSGYSGVSEEEKNMFVKQELQLQLSFLFDGKAHCGNVAITQDNIVPADGKMDKDKSLKIELKSGSC